MWWDELYERSLTDIALNHLNCLRIYNYFRPQNGVLSIVKNVSICLSVWLSVRCIRSHISKTMQSSQLHITKRCKMKHLKKQINDINLTLQYYNAMPSQLQNTKLCELKSIFFRISVLTFEVWSCTTFQISRWGSLQHFPDPQLVGRGVCCPSQEPYPRLGPSSSSLWLTAPTY